MSDLAVTPRRFGDVDRDLSRIRLCPVAAEAVTGRDGRHNQQAAQKESAVPTVDHLVFSRC